MKKGIANIILVVLFLTGLSLLLYPILAREWNAYRQKKLITGYQQVLNENTQEERFDYEAELRKAQAYNQSLLPQVLPDAFALAELAEVPDEEYISCLNLFGNGMMGIVEIPAIKLKVPVYHSTDEEVLEDAAGHIEGSSLPIGGADTHTVISAHRGLPTAALFTDLDQVKMGDCILIHVLDGILAYEVDQIHVVEPGDTEYLGIEEGQDLVTLMTCTPYGVNTHRLLVRGHRVEYSDE